eukprot:CAMPEP_0184691268 /NCGR_PEP_ID=MMETSP0313-20130426/171_1 /TAXON_ID=2792 /ORGANISM="Porphyridium aerugineum, Strain SAG 1380-2" /LENGTH=74 /DNA_ID=CAMNT_0027148947 /DNA_START=87 /DNA_END=314 /DNA_ORIENTATION=+
MSDNSEKKGAFANDLAAKLAMGPKPGAGFVKKKAVSQEDMPESERTPAGQTEAQKAMAEAMKQNATKEGGEGNK